MTTEAGATPERPRDRLGRPLPFDADRKLIYPQVPPRSWVTAEQAWHEAMGYLDRDMPFHAHEVFEQRWRCCFALERDAWRALAQWAAALTHHARGNEMGAQRVAQRALERMSSGGAVPEVIDLDLVRTSLRALVELDADRSNPTQTGRTRRRPVELAHGARTSARH